MSAVRYDALFASYVHTDDRREIIIAHTDANTDANPYIMHCARLTPALDRFLGFPKHGSEKTF